MSDQQLIRLWRIFARLAYFATAAVMFMNSGCTVAQRRTITTGAETVGIAYTALLTTIATHEMVGHFQEDIFAMRNPRNIRIAPRFYKPWTIREVGDVGVEWETRNPFAINTTTNYRAWRYITPAERLHERRIVQRRNVHGSLFGLVATNEFYTAFNEGQRTGEIDGRFFHAYALFLGMDTTVSAMRDYRNFNALAFGTGDLHDYLVDMKGQRETLRTAAMLDLVGKLPDMWWHMKGMVGVNDPPPNFWRFGRMEIRPAAVIIEWRFGWGVNATLSF